MDYSLDKKKTPKAVTPVTRPVAVPTAKVSPRPAPPITAQKPAPSVKTGGKVPKKPEGKKYTEEDIQNLLSEGYISVHPSLWDYIPTSAHIRYVKKDKMHDGSSRAERFKPGGFVRNHFTTDEGKKMMMLETRPGGKQGEHGYISFPIAYEDVEELWKKYPRESFIEIHLIYTSLAHKKKQIEELEARIKKLEAALRK